MSSSNSDIIDILNNTIIYIYKYIVPIFYIVGNIGNLFSALIFSKKSWKKNVCIFYFRIYILFTSFYINSVIFSQIFTYGLNIKLQNFNNIICKIYFYILFLFPTISLSVLILASIDRLLISSQNIDTRLYSSKRLAYFSISVSTFFWIIFYIHLLIKVNLQEFYPTIFICYYDSSKAYRDLFSYCLMVILSMLAFKNVRHIRVIPRQQRNQIRSMTKKDFQLLRCLFVHDVVFIACGLWINAFYIYSTITKDQTKTSLEQTINNFANYFLAFIYDIFYCASFFIFIVISKAFRNEVKRVIFKIIGKNFVMSTRDDENRQENVVAVSNIVL